MESLIILLKRKRYPWSFYWIKPQVCFKKVDVCCLFSVSTLGIFRVTFQSLLNPKWGGFQNPLDTHALKTFPCLCILFSLHFFFVSVFLFCSIVFLGLLLLLFCVYWACQHHGSFLLLQVLWQKLNIVNASELTHCWSEWSEWGCLVAGHYGTNMMVEGLGRCLWLAVVQLLLSCFVFVSVFSIL